MSHSELLQRANAALQAGNNEEAMALCPTYLLSDPDNVAALRLYANLCAITGDVSHAIKAINHVIALNNMDEPCDYFYRGRWQLRAGKLDKAITDFDQGCPFGCQRSQLIESVIVIHAKFAIVVCISRLINSGTIAHTVPLLEASPDLD
jgi:tetratricopeptide (TPR) repeat protein